MQSFRLSFFFFPSSSLLLAYLAEDIRIGKGYNVRGDVFRKRYTGKEGNKENSLSLEELYFPWMVKGNLFLQKKEKKEKQKIRSHIKNCYRARYFK